jgi:hypothetical protein
MDSGAYRPSPDALPDEWPYNVEAHPDHTETDVEPVASPPERRPSPSRLPDTWSAGPTKRSPFGRKRRYAAPEPSPRRTRGGDAEARATFDQFAPEPKGEDFQHITFEHHDPEAGPGSRVQETEEPLDEVFGRPLGIDTDPLAPDGDLPAATPADDHALWGFEHSSRDTSTSPRFSPAPAELWAPHSPAVPELADQDEQSGATGAERGRPVGGSGRAVGPFDRDALDGLSTRDQPPSDAAHEEGSVERVESRPPARHGLSLRRRRARDV